MSYRDQQAAYNKLMKISLLPPYEEIFQQLREHLHHGGVQLRETKGEFNDRKIIGEIFMNNDALNNKNKNKFRQYHQAKQSTPQTHDKGTSKKKKRMRIASINPGKMLNSNTQAMPNPIHANSQIRTDKRSNSHQPFVFPLPNTPKKIHPSISIKPEVNLSQSLPLSPLRGESISHCKQSLSTVKGERERKSQQLHKQYKNDVNTMFINLKNGRYRLPVIPTISEESSASNMMDIIMQKIPIQCSISNIQFPVKNIKRGSKMKSTLKLLNLKRAAMIRDFQLSRQIVESNAIEDSGACNIISHAYRPPPNRKHLQNPSSMSLNVSPHPMHKLIPPRPELTSFEKKKTEKLQGWRHEQSGQITQMQQINLNLTHHSHLNQ